MAGKFKSLAGAVALYALAMPHAAMAKACVEEIDLADAVVYMMPVAYSAVQSKCSSVLSHDGFLNRQGDSFIAPYAAAQAEAWPGAFEVFKTMGASDKAEGKNEGSDELMKMADSMPPEILRPFLDTFIEMKLAEEIKSDACGKIERLMEPLAPMPPENVGSLVAGIFGIVPGIDDPKICSAKSQ